MNEHGPIQNPVFGTHYAFFTDQKHFVPLRSQALGMAVVMTMIAVKLGNHATWSRAKGHVETSKGQLVREHGYFLPTVRMPDISYHPRAEHNRRDLQSQHTWTYHKRPFAPTLAVEIDELSGEHSQLEALDRKMKTECFTHGVQLGWLVDPRPDSRRMYEYKRDEHGQVFRVDNDSWRDMDAGDVLPGFTLYKTDLDRALNQEPGWSEEEMEQEEYVCPESGCSERFSRLGGLLLHLSDRFDECAR